MTLQSIVLPAAKEYLSKLSTHERASIMRNITALEMHSEGVDTKQLRGQIRELIVGHHRLTYFKLGTMLYFVRGFRKKSAKAPIREIEYAIEVYYQIIHM